MNPTLSPTAEGIARFLTRYCPCPALIEPVLTRNPLIQRLTEGQYLCRRGEAAECLWIIDRGVIAVAVDGKIVRRGAGEIVGEGAFYRPGDEARRRGADMVAEGTTCLWEIDHGFLASLTTEQAACWHETIARALTLKLDEATAQRSDLGKDGVALHNLIGRFICQDGIKAALGALHSRGEPIIEPKVTRAILWFSDLAGFSRYAKELAPGEVGAVIRSLMDVQIAAIREAGGQIDKLMGDGLMAYWIVPDDARERERLPRAVEAALTAVQGVLGIAGARGLDLDLRVGLHVGEVVIGDFGGNERIAFTLIGETVNTASRYEQAKRCTSDLPLGRVRVSDAVYAALTAHAVLERFEPTPRTFIDKSARSFVVHPSID
ncbi:adenylate/guanylate cyclase domain-containing protein [Salinarimonas sp. NSM]|uniref:adenylate/guanylate cyclase domain-containing protein n=1 Tax=Salinarimonas sp. NSM TaxID=3458003 RepID=UPI0040367304